MVDHREHKGTEDPKEHKDPRVHRLIVGSKIMLNL